VPPSVLGMHKIGPLWRRGRHWKEYQERKRRTPCCWPLLVWMPKASPGRSPSLRMSMWRSIVPRKCLRGSAKHNSRSSPFCRPGALSCVIPSSVPPGHGITYPRGCGLRPSVILKWSGTFRILGGGFRCRGVSAWALAQRHLPRGGSG
jgi:hypothetical protein